VLKQHQYTRIGVGLNTIPIRMY